MSDDTLRSSLVAWLRWHAPTENERARAPDACLPLLETMSRASGSQAVARRAAEIEHVGAGDAMIDDTDTRAELPVTPEQLDTMLHALGIRKRAGKWSAGGWRNYFSTTADADSYPACAALAAGGWMKGFACAGHDGENWTFRVTSAGIAALRLAGWNIEVEP